jgi:hypothetical protein
MMPTQLVPVGVAVRANAPAQTSDLGDERVAREFSEILVHTTSESAVLSAKRDSSLHASQIRARGAAPRNFDDRSQASAFVRCPRGRSGVRDARAEPLQTVRDKVAIAVGGQELKGSEALLGDSSRFGGVAEREVTVGEIEIERREERLGTVVGNCLGMLGGDAIPVEGIVERRLMASQKMGRDTRFVVIAPRIPSLSEEHTRRTRIAVHSHPGGTETCNNAVPVDHAHPYPSGVR